MTDDAFANLGPSENEGAEESSAASTFPSRDMEPAEDWTPRPIPHALEATAGAYLRHSKLGTPTHVWPYRNADGELEGFICRFTVTQPDGTTGKEIRPRRWGQTTTQGGSRRNEWRWKGWGEGRPLYRLAEILSRPEAKVLVTEGEKSADAAAILFPDMVTTTAMNGAKSPGKTDWTPLAGRNVIIATDNDDAGRNYGQTVCNLLRDAGTATATRLKPTVLGAWVWRDGEKIRRDGDIPRGWDLADALEEGWTAERITLLLAEPSTSADFFATMEPEDTPPSAQSNSRETRPRVHDWPFRLTADGVEFRVEKQNKGTGDIEVEWVRFASVIKVAADTRDQHGQAWGRLIVVRDRDGREHEWAMPMSMMAGSGEECRRHLLELGLELVPVLGIGRARQLLEMYLVTARPTEKARCVDVVGWQSGAYVTPGRVYGDTDGERIILQTVGSMVGTLCQGSLERWQSDIAALAVGNSRLALALCVAFVGPLLHLVGEESHGFHFSGGSSSGKTTALRIAASAWGVPIRSWRTTDNAAEGLARAANDGLLLLDELSQVDGKVADAMAYMLGNGQGKGRMGKDTSSRPVSAWRLAFLSTGEVGLVEKVAEAGKKAKAGQAVRLIEIPADAGAGLKLFDTLHDFTSGDALARHLRTAADRHQGHAIKRFLERVVTDVPAITEAVEMAKAKWLAEYLPPGADGQVSRVAGRFALAAAAGELATALGVLPWPIGEASRAAAICFRAWLDRRGGIGAAEVTAGIDQVRAFIEMYGSSRFTEVGGHDEVEQDTRAINRVGFRREDWNGRWEYFVLPQAWKEEVCKGIDAQAVAKELLDRGLLAGSSDGKCSKTQRIQGYGKPRVYHLTSKILAEGDDNV